MATGLEVPWEIAFLRDGRALVTERPGRVRLLSAEGELDPEAIAQVDVAAVGEGGLLGLAVDPEFEQNAFVYLYRTTEAGNEVVRYRLERDELVRMAPEDYRGDGARSEVFSARRSSSRPTPPGTAAT